MDGWNWVLVCNFFTKDIEMWVWLLFNKVLIVNYDIFPPVKVAIIEFFSKSVI